jgi:hypothetical protein
MRITTMYTENIIRDIRDIIYDVKQSAARAYSNSRDIDRINLRVGDEREEHYGEVVDALVDASNALDQAKDDMLNIEEMLHTLIYNIEMEALSAKVQGRATEKVQSK